ncbi:O-antigen ligase family protein [bacterium]|nr:MAG: O-antigen ligase family protein [bacterium]
MDIAVLIVAIVYSAGFWAVCWKHPSVALALIFATAPFQNDLSAGLGSVKFSFAEINLVLALPMFVVMLVTNRRRLQTWPLLWTSLAYAGACIASGLVKWHGSVAISAFIQVVLFLFIIVPIFALLGRRPEDMKPALWGLLGVGAFLGTMMVATRSQTILEINKNGLGGSYACALIVGVELWFHYREKPTRHKNILLVLMGLVSMGLLLTLSRGGWIAATGGIFVVAALRRQFVLLGRAVVVLVPLLAIAWGLVPQESRDYATNFNSERGNIKQRYLNRDAAMKAWQTNIWFGDGIGLRKELDATNFVVFALGETGIVGLVTFLGMFVAFFLSLWHARSKLPRNDFAFSLLCIGGGLMMSRLLQGMVDHYWARGPTMMSWAAAGMATGALWYKPLAATDQLQRARALLSLHLLESLRRGRDATPSLPQLTRAELEAAQNALALVKNGKQVSNHSAREARGENDALAELAQRLRANGH